VPGGAAAVIIEAAVESLEAASAAQQGGANRIELCADLAHGGTTPSLELLRTVLGQVNIPVFVLIRPRPGDFCYSAAEHRLMLEQIRAALQAGAAGIVTGALTAQQDIDQVRTAELFAAARPAPVTFHRAFDECRLSPALEVLVALGAQRVLTSGGARTAPEGIEQLRTLVVQAAGRVTILAGGGITPDTVTRLVQSTGVREVHFSVNNIDKVRAIRTLLG
jgi:copper homeostasis protein